jgi:hypothetical protein
MNKEIEIFFAYAATIKMKVKVITLVSLFNHFNSRKKSVLRHILLSKIVQIRQ